MTSLRSLRDPVGPSQDSAHTGAAAAAFSHTDSKLLTVAVFVEFTRLYRANPHEKEIDGGKNTGRVGGFGKGRGGGRGEEQHAERGRNSPTASVTTSLTSNRLNALTFSCDTVFVLCLGVSL